MIASVGELAPAVKAAQTAQRRHMYGSGQACECGFVPIDMADWARHRMAEALEAALAVLAPSEGPQIAVEPRNGAQSPAVAPDHSNAAQTNTGRSTPRHDPAQED